MCIDFDISMLYVVMAAFYELRQLDEHLLVVWEDLCLYLCLQTFSKVKLTSFLSFFGHIYLQKQPRFFVWADIDICVVGAN